MYDARCEADDFAERTRMEAHAHTVFVIDDNHDIRETLRAFLELEGFRVETAVNGRDALGRLQQGLRPCAIVLDLMMPIVDGYEFRRCQLEHPELSAIPVIVLSASDDWRHRDELRGACVLLKPADAASIIELVRRLCTTERPRTCSIG